MFLGSLFGQSSGFGGVIYFAGLILTYAFLYSWMGFVPGVPLAVLALHKGLAGWAMALLGGGLSGAGVGAFLGVPIPAALVGALMAGLYWLALRLLAPRAFVGPTA